MQKYFNKDPAGMTHITFTIGQVSIKRTGQSDQVSARLTDFLCDYPSEELL
jgi:hypothetical protein